MANAIGALALIGVIGAGGFVITHQDSGDTPPKSNVSAEAQAVSDQIDRDRAEAEAHPRPTWDAPTVPPSVTYPFKGDPALDAELASAVSTADSLSAKAAKGTKKQTAAQKQAKQKAAKQPKQKQPKATATTVKATTTASPTAVPTAASTTATGGHMPSTMPSTPTAPNFVTHGVKIH